MCFDRLSTNGIAMFVGGWMRKATELAATSSAPRLSVPQFIRSFPKAPLLR
jgi:hypothetical protein